MDHIKEAVTPAFAGWTVNGTTLTVGTVFEQWGVQIIALLGLCITGYFQWRQSQRDKKRLSSWMRRITSCILRSTRIKSNSVFSSISPHTQRP
jgi:hypothetical protein